MAFAASPTGSIGSRLPQAERSPSHSTAEVEEEHDQTPVKDWRYSLAPHLLATAEVDVREPVPEGSPTLPEMVQHESTTNREPAVEPLSSGFNSPVDDHVPETPLRYDLPARPQPDLESDAREPTKNFATGNGDDELERTMTQLKVCSDDENVDMELEESPIVSHLKRISAEIPNPAKLSDIDDPEIFLSEPAEAAAESAKAKRGLLRRLFPRREHRQSVKVEDSTPLSKIGLMEQTPCPDPTLHKLMSMGVCPDPGAHLRFTPPNMSDSPMVALTPEVAMNLLRNSPSPLDASLRSPDPPFRRTSATGSPMPFVRPHTATAASSPGPHYEHMGVLGYGPPLAGRPLRRPGTRNGPPAMASEHFQPGWYYAREPNRSTEGLNPTVYSFSTAAAKLDGQSAAPDSRIRDSYRTDTLTPLAKVPSRFRKTGLGALAGPQAVGRLYDEPERVQSRNGRPHTSRSHRAGDIQFRSSPPRPPQRMFSANQKRRRGRESDDERFDVHEDVRPMSGSRLEDGEEPIDVDEDTRAAVRMSLYGSEPESNRGGRQGMQEVSPNVTTWRKGMRQPRKKRRPSYWDGDLKQIRDSPAGRQVHSIQPGAERFVMTSPAKEDVESVRVSVREDIDSVRGREGHMSEQSQAFFVVEDEAENVPLPMDNGEEMEELGALNGVEFDGDDKMDVEM
jgi:hypothetical protein